MTFGIQNILGIHRLHNGRTGELTTLFLHNYKKWPEWKKLTYDTLIGCHFAHLLDMLVAVIAWFVFFPSILFEAKEWSVGWVSKIIFFNLVCEFTIYSFWHYMTYASEYAEGKLREKKYNPKNQYEPTGRAGFFFSSSGNLQREVTFTTLGWLQSASLQCLMTNLWANNRIPVYMDFWSRPVYSVTLFLLITYWRELHFYVVHRFIHPWWNVKFGLKEGDVGAFLYRNVHSLHHKSYNPGPWSGLSMHPVEHFLYYSVAWFPLVMMCHPLHFLYTKFHADISPIGGHDGYAVPHGNDFHYLHHAKFECNYGTTLVPLDRLFGSELLGRKDLQKAVPARKK